MSSTFVDLLDRFPAQSILPKSETQVPEFLSRYPQCDGRNVVVAIFDTGVDPGAAGLQVTSNGRPKIVDVVDCTGDGDVDMTTERTLDDAFSTLEGLAGKKLKIGKWTNPTGKYFVGLKRAFDVYPQVLKTRRIAERKKKFDEEQRQAVAELQRAINAAQKGTPEEKVLLKNLENQLEQLQDLHKSYDDPGPLLDCVVFHDGKVWRAAIDIEESGDLTHAVLLTDYRLERQYITVSKEDMLNVAVNIYDNGKVLSLVMPSGAHGTHVGAIVGACFPDQPELNGIAPGAQLVSVKIGDARLDSMETCSALVRGLISVINNKVDMINMSFGEATLLPNVGRFIELAKETVNKHGVIFVSSAGNNGPGLSTVGCPGSTTDALIGVGAYVSPGMAEVEYSLREKVPENMYTWSSRGPSLDGDRGVCISAQGGAITSVPNYILSKSQLMNGTSMSAPSCCGGIALLLSGMKAEGLEYSPQSVRRAIENSARPVDGQSPLEVGCGLLQVVKAFEYLKQNKMEYHMRYTVAVGPKKARGIYVREHLEASHIVDQVVTVEPVFHENADNTSKISFEKRIHLRKTQDWLDIPEFLVLTGGERNFRIRVDPSKLDMNITHYGEVWGIEDGHPEAGPLFRVPVTIIRPEQTQKVVYSWKYKPGTIHRAFLSPPVGATYAKIFLRGKSIDTVRRYMVYCMQAVHEKSYKETSFREYTDLHPDQQARHIFQVVPDHTMELCVAQFWSSLGSSQIEVEVKFFGIYANNTHVHLDGYNPVVRVDLHSPLETKKAKITVSLEKVQRAVRPSSSIIKPLSTERDLLPDGRQIYGLELSYKFKLEEDAEVECGAPGLSDLLYESPYESQMWYITDAAGKNPLKWGDAYPSHYTIKLVKGNYNAKLHIRHDASSKLEALKNMALVLKMKMEKKTLKVYDSLNNALSDEKPITNLTLKKGHRKPIYVRTDESVIPKQAKIGDMLIGDISYQPGAKFSFTFTVPPPKEDTKPPSPPSVSQKPADDQLEDIVLEEQVKFLSKLLDKKQFEEYEKVKAHVLEKHPNHLPLLQLELRDVDSRPDRSDNLPQVIDAADKLIDSIDLKELAIHYGLKLDSEDTQATQLRAEMDKKKGILIDALFKKQLALMESKQEKAEENYQLIKKWVDFEDAKYAELSIKYFLFKGRYGDGLKSVAKQLKALEAGDSKKAPLYTEQMNLVEKSGWPHWHKYLQAWSTIRSHPKEPCF